MWGRTSLDCLIVPWSSSFSAAQKVHCNSCDIVARNIGGCCTDNSRTPQLRYRWLATRVCQICVNTHFLSGPLLSPTECHGSHPLRRYWGTRKIYLTWICAAAAVMDWSLPRGQLELLDALVYRGTVPSQTNWLQHQGSFPLSLGRQSYSMTSTQQTLEALPGGVHLGRWAQA